MRTVVEPDEVLEVALGRACTAVEHCLVAAGPVDHMQLAHTHVLTGLDLLQCREATLA